MKKQELKGKNMIRFNIAPYIGNEMNYIEQVIKNEKICGDGDFTKRCSTWIEERFNVKKVLFTTSCTHALEMAALLLDVQHGDEVIMPSYTFVSTANAFVMRGAKIIFIDIRPDTMNMDENLIEMAITKKTKAIVPVHYAGVACEMDKIMDIAKKHNLYVVEDAAQGMMASYKGQALGTFGEFGCYSFHETKNYSMGEGGAILVNDEKYIERSEIVREKGTDRSKFFRGEIDKYTWVDIGSSYLPSEINVAYLYPQLQKADKINKKRLLLWNQYHEGLSDLEKMGKLKRPFVPQECRHNAHMYYIKTEGIEERQELIQYLRKNGVYAVFHYLPLHSSEAGKRYGVFYGEDRYTTNESERLLRLPLYYSLESSEVEFIIRCIYDFYNRK